jgi:hypothetical protein
VDAVEAELQAVASGRRWWSGGRGRIDRWQVENLDDAGEVHACLLGVGVDSGQRVSARRRHASQEPGADRLWNAS